MPTATPAELILDASVLGAALFNESRSDAARALLIDRAFIAPDLLALEIASIAAKKVWRGEAAPGVAARAVSVIGMFVSRMISSSQLADDAFRLAAKHRFSAYDAAYLALAAKEKTQLATFDEALAERARRAGFGALIYPVPAPKPRPS